MFGSAVDLGDVAPTVSALLLVCGFRGKRPAISPVEEEDPAALLAEAAAGGSGGAPGGSGAEGDGGGEDEVSLFGRARPSQDGLVESCTCRRYEGPRDPPPNPGSPTPTPYLSHHVVTSRRRMIHLPLQSQLKYHHKLKFLFSSCRTCLLKRAASTLINALVLSCLNVTMQGGAAGGAGGVRGATEEVTGTSALRVRHNSDSDSSNRSLQLGATAATITDDEKGASLRLRIIPRGRHCACVSLHVSVTPRASRNLANVTDMGMRE